MKVIKLLSAVAVASILATTANANTITYGGTQVNQPYVGLKVGQFADGYEKASRYNVTGYGVYGGYNFDQNFGAEGEYLITDKKELNAGSGVDTKAQTYGAYGTYRYNFDNTPFYAKAKAGIAKIEARHTTPIGVFKGADTSFAYGLGAGYQNGNIGIEASFSRPHADVDVISLGANLAF